MKQRRQWTATVLTAVLVVLVSGIVVTVYHLISIDRLDEAVNQTQYQLISSIQQSVDTELRSIDNALLALAFSRLAQGYMDTSMRTELSLVDSLQGVQRQLFGIRAINEGVRSAWAVSIARNAVVSDSSSSPLVTFHDRAWIESVRISSWSFRAVERRVQIHPRLVQPPETSDVLSIVRSYPVLATERPYQRGLFVANVDLDHIASLCDLGDEVFGAFVVVSERDGSVVVSSGRPRHDAALAPIVRSASSIGRADPLQVEIEGEGYQVIHRLSTFTDWVYTLVVPVSYLQARTRAVTSTQIAVLVLLCVTGMVTAAGVLRWSFRPLIRFVERVDSRLSGPPGPSHDRAGRNELVRIETAVERMVEDNEVMRQQIKQHAPVVRWQILMDLLMNGTQKMPWNKHLQALRDLGVQLESGAFLVLVVGPDDETGWSTELSAELCESGALVALNVGRGVGIEVWNRRVALLVTLREGTDGADLHGMALSEELRESVSERHGVSVSVGVSAVHSEPDGIADAYREAVHALNHRLVFGPGSIVAYGEVEVSFAPEIARLYADIERVLRAIYSLQSSEVPDRIREWFARAVEKGADLPTLRRLAVHLLMAASGRAAEAGISVSGGTVPLAADTPDELVEQVSRRLLELSGAMEETRTSDRGAALVARAQQIIRERFGDASLSLSSVAEEIGVSQSHLSRLFHEVAGVRFVDALIETRIDRAKKLLCAEGAVAHVGRQVGYNNSHSFLRIFKRCTGMTPSEYRSVARSRSYDKV